MTRGTAFGNKEVRIKVSLYVRKPKGNIRRDRVEKNKLINKQRKEGSLTVQTSVF